MALSVDIEKKLGNFQLNVTFNAGNEVLALLGASGCGKSMTLKCIAGIETPDRGRIILDGVTLFDSEKKINLSPQKRKVGYLFQQYALFPNMTVEQNIACGVREKKGKKERIASMLQTMNLAGMEKKKPHQLSGGQQQRAALARILINEPEVILLDEPFSALDTHLRFRLEREVQSMIRQFGKTVVLVSHDRDEVFRLSDSIALMNNGNIERLGDKKGVFNDPKTKNGAVLTGCKNISHARKLDEHHILAEDWNLRLYVSEVSDTVQYIGIRLHDVELGKGENTFYCNVVDEIENPFSYTLMVRPIDQEDGEPFGIQLSKEIWNSAKDERITVNLPSEAILLLGE